MKLKMSMILDVDDSEQVIENLKNFKFSDVKSVSDLNVEAVDDVPNISTPTSWGHLTAFVDEPGSITIVSDNDEGASTVVECKEVVDGTNSWLVVNTEKGQMVMEERLGFLV